MIYVVKGNTIADIGLPLQLLTVEQSSQTITDYYPSSTDVIEVNMRSACDKETMQVTVDGNVLHWSWTPEKIGCYAIEVKITQEDGTRMRSFRKEQVCVCFSNDLLPNDDGDVEFVSETMVLDAVEIVYAVGPQGETGNGIESIEKTSTVGLVDTYTITYTDSSTTTFTVTNGEDADIAAAEAATQAANEAAELANTKAGLANDAATLANTKAGLANTAAQTANDAAELANTKAGLANTAANAANDAAELANTKAGLANTAATAANDAAELANTKAGLANTAAQTANDAAEAATVAAAYNNELNISAIYPTGGTNSGNTYSLANAIAMVPSASRKEGMKVTFISDGTDADLTSGDAYTYQYVGSSWAVANFQIVPNGLDDEPTAGSDNLVKSGGVFKNIADFAINNEIKQSFSIAGSGQKILLDNLILPAEEGTIYKITTYGEEGARIVIECVNSATGNTVKTSGWLTIPSSGNVSYEFITSEAYNLKIRFAVSSSSGGNYNVTVSKSLTVNEPIQLAINDKVEKRFYSKANTTYIVFGNEYIESTENLVEYTARVYGTEGKKIAVEFINVATGNSISSSGWVTIGESGYVEWKTQRNDLDLKVKVITSSTSAGNYRATLQKTLLISDIADEAIEEAIESDIINNTTEDDLKTSQFFTISGFIKYADGSVDTSNPNAICTPYLKIGIVNYIKLLGLSGENAALVAFYDSSKTFISAINGSQNNEVVKVVTDIPENAEYIRVSGIMGVLNIANCGKYTPYNYVLRNNSYFTISNNFVKYGDGEYSPHPNYKSTDFIKYNGRGLLIEGAANEGNVALVAFYDSSKTFISAIRGFENDKVNVTLLPYQIPSNTSYFKVSCHIDQDGNIINGDAISDILDNFNENNRKTKPAYQFTGADYNVSSINVSEGFVFENTLAIYQKYDTLVSNYPDYVTKIDCDAIMTEQGIERPSALEEIPMYMYKFKPTYAPVAVDHSGTPNYNTINAFIVTGTHDEPYAIETLYNCMQKICQNWSNDCNLEALRFNVTFWIMPVGNPWAMMQSDAGGGGNIRVNYNGVDLNRNMATSKWVAGEVGSRTYGGTEPNSEYESKVLAYMLNEASPQIFIDFHNFGVDYVGNMMYFAAPESQNIKDICAEIVSKTTRILKSEDANYPQDTTTMLGWLSPEGNSSTRSLYALEHGVNNSITMEVSAGCPWQDGQLLSSGVGDTSPALFMTENLQICTYTILRLIYNLTIQ